MRTLCIGSRGTFNSLCGLSVGGQLRLELSHTCKILSSYGAHDLRELLGELRHVLKATPRVVSHVFVFIIIEKMKACKRRETSLCRPIAAEQFLQVHSIPIA